MFCFAFVFVSDGNLFCKEHIEEVSPKCVRCKEPIYDGEIYVKERAYHNTCFACGASGCRNGPDPSDPFTFIHPETFVPFCNKHKPIITITQTQQPNAITTAAIKTTNATPTSLPSAAVHASSSQSTSSTLSANKAATPIKRVSQSTLTEPLNHHLQNNNNKNNNNNNLSSSIAASSNPSSPPTASPPSNPNSSSSKSSINNASSNNPPSSPPPPSSSSKPSSSISPPIPKDEEVDSDQQCFTCKKVLGVGVAMMVEGKIYHRDCIRCSSCKCGFPDGTGIFPKEDKFYCRNHYLEKFATKCKACLRYLEAGRVVSVPAPDSGADEGPNAAVYQYHALCFVCVQCGTSLAGSMYLMTEDEQLYCESCAMNFE